VLSSTLKIPANVLSLNARNHGRILATQRKQVDACFEKSKWTCHLCGIRIPEMMEIDHLDGHKHGPSVKLATICQFCHNLKHPLWSASRGRLVPMIAPQLSQVDIHRLAWSIVLLRDAGRNFADIDPILEGIEQRTIAFEKKFGTRLVTPFLESAINLPKMIGDMAAPVLMQIDQSVRFWPADLTTNANDLPPAARISAWDLIGFRKASRTTANLLIADNKFDADVLREDAEKAMAQMSGFAIAEDDAA
jgi:hypothetical protein